MTNSDKPKSSPVPNFRVPEFLKTKTFGVTKKGFGGPQIKFNPSQFKTQHKGGS